MRDNNFKHLIGEFDVNIPDDLLGSEIKTGEDYSIPGKMFSEDE